MHKGRYTDVSKTSSHQKHNRRSADLFLVHGEAKGQMTLQEQAQTIRFFEGLGKPLSAREIEILAEDEQDRLNTFLFGNGKEGGFEGLTRLINQSGGLEEEE